jgi:CRISPR-associated protein Cst2
MNLFATVLTYSAPSANYRGESELNRTVIQKVTEGRFDYPIISPESMRNALREILAGDRYELPTNRCRVEPLAGDDKSQLSVQFKEFPDPDKYADDFFFGYLLAIKGKDLENLRKQRGKDFPIKRDSVLRMNLAKALEPYRHNSVFTQSPKLTKDNPWKVGEAEGGTSSALLHRETAVTAFQFPFALNMNDCRTKPDWTRKLLQAIGELNEVAGNHARSYFEMAPASIIVRLTDSLVAGFNTYCFKPDGDLPDVIQDIIRGDCGYDGKEFYLGGEIVKRGLTGEQKKSLEGRDVTLKNCPRELLGIVADKALGR